MTSLNSPISAFPEARRGSAVENARPRPTPSVFRRAVRWRYAATGFLLGICAPAGAYLLRLLFGIVEGNGPLDDLTAESFFYLYSLIGTSAVFSVTGYLAGRRLEALRRSQHFFHRLSELDPTTGLLNARTFEERYRRARDRSRAHGEPLSLLLLDVDHLKLINDRLGHEAGTAALRHISMILAGCKRDEDEAARWGGDEFTILMEGADADSAARLAASILETARATPLRFGGNDVDVLVTIGVASDSSGARRNLFALADAALYEAKGKGRNQWRLG